METLMVILSGDTNGGNVSGESSDVSTLDPPVDTTPQGM